MVQRRLAESEPVRCSYFAVAPHCSSIHGWGHADDHFPGQDSLYSTTSALVICHCSWMVTSALKISSSVSTRLIVLNLAVYDTCCGALSVALRNASAGAEKKRVACAICSAVLSGGVGRSGGCYKGILRILEFDTPCELTP